MLSGRLCACDEFGVVCGGEVGFEVIPRLLRYREPFVFGEGVGTLPGGYIRSVPLPRLQTDHASCRPVKVGATQSPRMSQVRRENMSQNPRNNIVYLPEQ